MHRLTDAVWRSWCEAAAVTFSRFYPDPPRPFALHRTDGSITQAMVTWPKPDKTTLDSHANTTDATECGAYAVAAWAVFALDGWRVIARTQTESGADVWIARPGGAADSQVRLEISGMAQGSDAAAFKALQARLVQKVAQVRAGNIDVPGMASVVGFELLCALVSEIVGS